MYHLMDMAILILWQTMNYIEELLYFSSICFFYLFSYDNSLNVV